MNLLFQIALLSLSIASPQTPAKWRVALPDGLVVVAPTRDLARERAAKLAAYSGTAAPDPKPDTLIPSAERRHVEEATTELLFRLEALSNEANTDDAGVRATANESLGRFRAKAAQDAIVQLNKSLEKAAMERLVASLANSGEPSSVPNAELIGEPRIVSSFEGIPDELRPGYVALLERLEGLRAMTTPQAPTYKRDLRLKALLSAGAQIRLEAKAVKNKTEVKLNLMFTARSGSGRTQALVSDRWALKKGGYQLAGSSVISVQSLDVIEATRNRILQAAKAEYAAVQERHEKQRVAAEKKLADQAAAEQSEKERLAREEADQKAEQERRDREEKARREAEERKNQLDQYRRQLEEATNDLNRLRDSRNSARSDLDRARSDQRDAERDADQARSRRDDLAGKVRDAEQRLEDAKRDGKPTGALQSIVSELKDQLSGAERQYDDTHSRADDARRRGDDLERTIQDLDSQAQRVASDIDELRNRISQLGG